MDITVVSRRTPARSPVSAILALACIALLPLLFTLVDHGDCYGGGPSLLDAVAWPDVGDGGDCCADLRTSPPSRLARSLLGAELLGFLFAPVAVGVARVLGLVRARGAAAVVAAILAFHLATLAQGERWIGAAAFVVMGVGALLLAPFTYLPALLVARSAERDPAVAPGPSGDRRVVLGGTALAVLAVPAWLFLAVAHEPPAGTRDLPTAGAGCSGR